jgi:hypothetical protein
MTDSKKRPPFFFIYSQAGACLGPERAMYSLILDAAVVGGWRPARDLAEYARHRSVVPSQEASSLADGLENALRWFHEHPNDAGDLERFRWLADNPRWPRIVDFFRGGDLQLDDFSQPGRVRPWGLWSR